MGVLEKIAAARGVRRKSWSEPPFWAFDDLSYPLLSTFGSAPDKEQIENDFEGYVRGALKANGIVFACIAARQALFSQAVFKWRAFNDGEAGKPFGTQELRILEEPWATGTTGDLLSLAEVDVSLAGNFWATTADDNGRLGAAATGPGRRIVRMRPDWVTMVLGSHSGDPNALDTKIVGILYEPRRNGGLSNLSNAVLLLPSEVCHYSMHPDPDAHFRGISWLTPIIREIQADKATTIYKEKFFTNGAVPSLVVKFDRDTNPEDMTKFKDRFEAAHRGTWNSFKTLFLSGGADVTPVGINLKDLEFGTTQGKGENRITVASRVPAVILGISEGLGGSALNSGNYNQSKRTWAEGAMQDMWNKITASFRNLVRPPGPNVKLFADTRHISFLRDDAKDVADVQQTQANTIRTLSDAGAKWDAAVEFVQTGDLGKLIGNHSGLYSVQLQPPGSDATVTVDNIDKAAELVSVGWKLISLSKAPAKELEPPLKELTA